MTLAEMTRNIDWVRNNRAAFVAQFCLERGHEYEENRWLARKGKKLVVRRRLGKQIIELYAAFAAENCIEEISRGGMPNAVAAAEECRVYICS